MGDISAAPTTEPTVLVFRSPSGRTEVARRGDSFVIHLREGRDELDAQAAAQLASALIPWEVPDAEAV